MWLRLPPAQKKVVLIFLTYLTTLILGRERTGKSRLASRLLRQVLKRPLLFTFLVRWFAPFCVYIVQFWRRRRLRLKVF